MAALESEAQISGQDSVAKSCKFVSEIMINRLFENRFKIQKGVFRMAVFFTP